jgi:invasion protein IalB
MQRAKICAQKICAQKMLWLLAAAVAVTMAGRAAAQQAPARPLAATQHTAQLPMAAPSEAPQRTTATYDDWVVQCDTQAGSPPQKICDMAQVAQVNAQGHSTPFSRVAVVHPVKGQPVRLVVQVPVNVSFATTVRIQTSDSDPGIAAPFARCLSAGCFAEFDIKDDVLKKLRAATGSGKVSFADGGGHEISVPLSFNGFNQAYEALVKE